MTKITCDMATSLDGFVAGPNQSLEKPFGEGVGERLHRWMHRWMLEEPEANAAEIDAITAAGAGLIDELRLHVAPMLLGAGERLLDGAGDPTLEPLAVNGNHLVTHLRYRVVR